VIGTSLQVYPAAQIPLSVKLKHPPAMVVEVNREPSAMYNQVSDVLLLGSAAEILSRLMETLEDKVGERASQSSV
jgi:NAD-dependent SIR2 family protein deacetylase